MFKGYYLQPIKFDAVKFFKRGGICACLLYMVDNLPRALRLFIGGVWA